LAKAYVRESIGFYRETRDRIRQEFTELGAAIHNGNGAIPVAFYGAGELAEIAYVCLQDTPFELVALIDPVSTRSFFDTPVCRPADLSGATVRGRGFARLIVMPVENEQEVQDVLAARSVPPDQVFWL
jgi:hypothetical protein